MIKKTVYTVVAIAMAFSFSFAGAANYNFQTNLTMGSTGSDVVVLQKFLNSKGFMVSSVGAGSPGNETPYFGSLTRSALARYQAANGISPAVGYFGPITRANVNAQSDSSTGGSSNNGGSSNTTLNGGDGDFKGFKVLGSPSNKNIEEGSSEKVLAFEFEADDSDLRIERIDVQVTGDGNTEKPWRYIDSIVLYNGNDEIASIDADSSSDWDEQDDDVYEITFSNIDEIVKEGKKVRFYIEVVAKDSIDDSDLPLDMTIFISDDGLRAVNAEGINVYEGRESQSKDFTIEQAEEGQLSISVDEDDNEDRVVEVEENDETEEVDLYTVQVESDKGDNVIEEVTVTLATTTGTVSNLSDIITTLYLFIDGDEVASESVNGGATDSVTFDDLDYEIDEDDEVEFVIKADINEQEDNFANGSGVKVTGMSIDYVDEQDDDQTESTNTEGGNITFNVDAIQVSLSKIPASQAPVSNDESRGRFYVEFKVTAPKSENIFIAKGATTSSDVASGQGAQFMVVDGNGNEVSATTSVSSNLLVKVSGGSETGGYYRISKGQTATFRLDIIVENTGAAEARTLGIQLLGINYKVGSTGVANEEYTSGIDEDFRSETEYLLTENISN